MRTLVIPTVGALTFVASAAPAQLRIAGTLSGVVTDSSGLVPGAAPRLEDEGTGVAPQTVSAQSGPFNFRDLDSGSHEVTVSLGAFQTAVSKNVIVESSRTTDLRVKSTAGQITETVLRGGVL